MWKEAVKHSRDADFVSSTYFLSNPDIEVSKVAATMMSNDYELSQRFKDNTNKPISQKLLTIVPQLILRLKACIVDEKIKDVRKQMGNVNESSEEFNVLMTKYTQLLMTKKKIAKESGQTNITL